MVADVEMDPAAPAQSPTGVEATGAVDGGKKGEARDEATVADAETDAAAPATPSPEVEASDAEDEGEKGEAQEEARDEATEDEPEAGEAAKEEKAEPQVSRSGRVRKSIEKFAPEVAEKKEKEIPEGKGEKLEDMPNVVANLKAVTWSDPRLYDLYTIIFGVGKKKEFKAHLLQFNGLALPEGKEEAERERLRNKIYRLKTAGLKAVMDLADIDRSAESFGDKRATPGKEALCDRFLEWLENPRASGRKPKAEKKKRKSSGSTGSAKKRKSTGSAKKEKKTTKKKTPTKKAPAEEDPADEDPAEESTTAGKKVAKKKKDKKKALKDNNGKEGASLVIPGTDIEKIRAKVKTIVETENKDELTVKAIRKRLEDWLDMDLSDQKDAVRTIVMEVM